MLCFLYLPSCGNEPFKSKEESGDEEVFKKLDGNWKFTDYICTKGVIIQSEIISSLMELVLKSEYKIVITGNTGVLQYWGLDGDSLEKKCQFEYPLQISPDPDKITGSVIFKKSEQKLLTKSGECSDLSDINETKLFSLSNNKLSFFDENKGSCSEEGLFQNQYVKD